MSGDRTEDTAVTDAEPAFLTLSHDLRLRILLALWNAPTFSLSFSELRKTVGARDSGTFNYHLSELEDHFVASTDDGYELQYPGHRVLDAIQSGVYHDEAPVGLVELDADCRTCGSRVTFEYGTDYIARVQCSTCDNRVVEWPFDPGGTDDRDPETVADAFDRRTKLIWSCVLDGICAFCAGHVHRDVATHPAEQGACVGVNKQVERYDEHFASDHPAIVSVDCSRCSFYSFIPVGVVLLTRPEAVGLLYDAGIDTRDTPLWDLGFVVDPDAVSFKSAEAVHVNIEIVDVAEPLHFTVDESFAVVPQVDG